MPIDLNSIVNLQQSDFTAGRKSQHKDVGNYLKQISSTVITYKTINGMNMKIEYESSYNSAAMMKAAAVDAVKLVQARGRVVPDLHLVITSANVPNIAFIGDANGNRDVTIFLGPKSLTYNKKANKHYSNLIKGGKGVQQGRGVPDHVYDYRSSFLDRPRARIKAIMVHELGHVLHETSSANIFWNLKKDTLAVHKPGAALASQISDYVVFQDNCLEFVAETFTGLMFGETYSNAVSTEYGNCAGP